MKGAATMHNVQRPLSRRRAISILAAAATLPPAGAAAASVEPFRWRGVVLGAAAEVTLYADSRRQAATAIDAALQDIARLEKIFSLHMPDSALVRLNRDGELPAPPFELVELLSQALRLSDVSGGRFDPTIQPLWSLLAGHFAAPGADPAGPATAALAAAREKVDYRAVSVAPERIFFARPGMQITLNGIAQGYVTDRVGAVLRERGFGPALLNLGEMLVLGRHPDGNAWRIGVAAAGEATQEIAEIEVASGAVATSAARGMLFEPNGRFNHIIDPTRLVCADRDCSVTVLAQSAATADGLSTLAALLPDPMRELKPLLARYDARAFLQSAREPRGAWVA
jgi:thiamine biosynthesis lipoprotein